jgi:hypothetical protein
VVPASAVVTSEAARQTQGNAKVSRHLGRELLLASARHDRRWVEVHVSLELFNTQAADSSLRLTPETFAEVAYASSRMLYAWDIPAWIENRPYIDASYTCSCPALELAAMGYDEVIAISPEYGPVYHDLFSTRAIPSIWHDTPIHFIQADADLNEFGVHCTQATEAGLLNAYRHGEEKGHKFLSEWSQYTYNLRH